MLEDAILPGQAADVLSRFESLGGRRQGCEFGLVQRAAGLEPLGLLRWTELFLHELKAALDVDFVGVGAPENTVILVSDCGEPEYIARDKRFGMSMHTGMTPDQASVEEAHRRCCDRQRFLAAKLLDDLIAADKIFVFRETTRRLSKHEMKKLHRSVSRLGGHPSWWPRTQMARTPAALFAKRSPACPADISTISGSVRPTRPWPMWTMCGWRCAAGHSRWRCGAGSMAHQGCEAVRAPGQTECSSPGSPARSDDRGGCKCWSRPLTA